MLWSLKPTGTDTIFEHTSKELLEKMTMQIEEDIPQHLILTLVGWLSSVKVLVLPSLCGLFVNEWINEELHAEERKERPLHKHKRHPQKPPKKNTTIWYVCILVCVCICVCESLYALCVSRCVWPSFYSKWHFKPFSCHSAAQQHSVDDPPPLWVFGTTHWSFAC